jgi:hypothetical protein
LILFLKVSMNMILPFRLCLLGLLLSFLSLGDLVAQTATTERAREANQAMALPDGRLGRILERYFEEGVGGRENYARLESLLIEGTIQSEETVLPFRVFKKKPDLFRIRMGLSARREWVMAFDGKVGWEQHPDRNEGQPRVMEGNELVGFKLDSAFASHLLYPLAPGRKMEFIDTVPVDGRVCHEIRITFDSGWVLTYFIDIRSFNEYKLKTLAPGEDTPRETIFEDFRLVSGIPVAHKVTTRRGEQLINTVRIERVEANMGVMPWMFAMPKD